jgi:hypothetical protein
LGRLTGGTADPGTDDLALRGRDHYDHHDGADHHDHHDGADHHDHHDGADHHDHHDGADHHDHHDDHGRGWWNDVGRTDFDHH